MGNYGLTRTSKINFQITEMELRKKYLYVLDISGKRDEEITTIVTNRAEREEAATAAEVAEGFAESLRRPVRSQLDKSRFVDQ